MRCNKVSCSNIYSLNHFFLWLVTSPYRIFRFYLCYNDTIFPSLIPLFIVICRITLGNQLDGVHLKDPDIVRRFREKYPDGNCMTPPKSRWKIVHRVGSKIMQIWLFNLAAVQSSSLIERHNKLRFQFTPQSAAVEADGNVSDQVQIHKQWCTICLLWINTSQYNETSPVI